MRDSTRDQRQDVNLMIHEGQDKWQ